MYFRYLECKSGGNFIDQIERTAEESRVLSVTTLPLFYHCSQSTLMIFKVHNCCRSAIGLWFVKILVICRFKCFMGIHLPFSMRTPENYFLQTLTAFCSLARRFAGFDSDWQRKWRWCVFCTASWFVLIDDRLQNWTNSKYRFSLSTL